MFYEETLLYNFIHSLYLSIFFFFLISSFYQGVLFFVSLIYSELFLFVFKCLGLNVFKYSFFNANIDDSCLPYREMFFAFI